MKCFFTISCGLAIAATFVTFKLGAQATNTNLPVITQLNHVHSYENGKALPLEKSMGKNTTKRKGLGYGGSEMRDEIDGATSSIKLAETANSFIINSIA